MSTDEAAIYAILEDALPSSLKVVYSNDVKRELLKTKIQQLIAQARLNGQIEELGNVTLDYGRYKATVWVGDELVSVEKRYEQLKSQGNQEGDK